MGGMYRNVDAMAALSGVADVRRENQELRVTNAAAQERITVLEQRVTTLENQVQFLVQILRSARLLL